MSRPEDVGEILPNLIESKMQKKKQRICIEIFDREEADLYEVPDIILFLSSFALCADHIFIKGTPTLEAGEEHNFSDRMPTPLV
ncbi:hypothetical protein EPA93_06050 [Ktedonosporobacter rubrisoli]|uniref:Uncharacterized protein n=1 Tax=Ktedonosporobacter rubrisoli TaxID=2509675 RepID=A0A4P6JKB2_KTERU|nr:hypothetical protein [Ktedonosporobacter rubrisoli]QBD75589.1 hypothetical protein EPA93_06050 [Ktedonosporobacter rubrisoli]